MLLSQDSSPTPSRLLGPYRPSFHVQKMIHIPFSRVAHYRSYRLLNITQMISQQEAWCIYDTKKRVVGLCPTLRNFTRKKAIALLAFVADLKDTFDNCSVCEVEALWVPACMLSDGAKEMYETYTASGLSTDADVDHGTWKVVVNALIQMAWQKTWFIKLVTRVS